MTFKLDERLTNSCIYIDDWSLSRILLKNNADYPWVILVPRKNNISDITELATTEKHQLMDEINAMATIMKTLFQPNQLNIGTLGNIVSQLHIHIVARFTHDKLWPHSVWQEALSNTPYNEQVLKELMLNFHSAIYP